VKDRWREPDPGNSFCDGSVPRDTSLAKTGPYLREKPQEISECLKTRSPLHRNTNFIVMINRGRYLKDIIGICCGIVLNVKQSDLLEKLIVTRPVQKL
jgi:hypothetical protein